MEYQRVISRRKFESLIKFNQVTRLANLISGRIENVKLKSKLEGSRDPKDNFLLSLSKDGNADYLVPGDLVFLF